MPYLIADSKDRDERQFLSQIQPNLELWTFEEEDALWYDKRSEALKAVGKLQDLGYSDHVSIVFWDEENSDYGDDSYDD